MQEKRFVKEIIKRVESLKAARKPFESAWQEIAKYTQDNTDMFDNSQNPDLLARLRVYDGTAAHSRDQLAAYLHAGLTNPASKWFMLKPQDTEAAEDDDAKRWLEDARDKMLRVFNSPNSNFNAQNHELMLDLVTYGTAAMFTDSDFKNGISFMSHPLSEIFIADDHRGIVDFVAREFCLTGRQAKQRWGKDLGIEILKEIDKEPDDKIKFIHVVMPREEPSNKGYKATKLLFASFYICPDKMKLVSEGGYHEFPWSVPRWIKKTGNPYGYGAAWNALPEMRTVNEMVKTLIKAGQKTVDPPVAMSDDGVLMPLRLQPGGINMGGIDYNGQMRIKPIHLTGNIEFGLKLIERETEAIKDKFFVNELQLGDRPRMTELEVAQRQNDSLRLTGPQRDRIQVEHLSPVIYRVFNLLLRNGDLGTPPEVLLDKDVVVEYLSPLSKLQSGSEVDAVLRSMSQVVPLVQIDPSIMDNVDVDKAVRFIFEGNGAPLKIIRKLEELQAMREERSEMQSQQAQLQQFQQMAEIAKTGNEAFKE